MFTPVGFARNAEADVSLDDLGDPLISMSELRNALHAAVREQQRRAFDAQEAAVVRQRAEGWARIEAAYALPDAGEVIRSGEWAGFTLDRATAWSWNLFDFEPHGATSHKIQLRFQQMKELEHGMLPQTYGYADRARTLEERGIDPREYRCLREQLRH